MIIHIMQGCKKFETGIKDDQYQLLLTDTDGSGSLAKAEVQNLKKAVGKLPGVSNVVVTISGRPHNASGLSGGAIFGVILALAVAAFAGYKGYHKYDLEFYLLSILPAKNAAVGLQVDVEITTVSGTLPLLSIFKGFISLLLLSKIMSSLKKRELKT